MRSRSGSELNIGSRVIVGGKKGVVSWVGVCFSISLSKLARAEPTGDALNSTPIFNDNAWCRSNSSGRLYLRLENGSVWNSTNKRGKTTDLWAGSDTSIVVQDTDSSLGKYRWKGIAVTEMPLKWRVSPVISLHDLNRQRWMKEPYLEYISWWWILASVGLLVLILFGMISRRAEFLSTTTVNRVDSF